MTVPEMLKMSQADLDDLFTQKPGGRHSRRVKPKGTAIVAPGHDLQRKYRQFRQSLCLAGQSLRPGKRRAAQQDHALRPERDHRQGLQGRELDGWQGVHRARLLRDFAPRPLDSRRDPRGRAAHLSRQSLLEQEAPDRFRARIPCAPNENSRPWPTQQQHRRQPITWWWRILLLVVLGLIIVGAFCLRHPLHPRRAGRLRPDRGAFQIRFVRRRARVRHSLLDLEGSAQIVSRVSAREKICRPGRNTRR